MNSRRAIFWLMCCGMAIFTLSAAAEKEHRTTLSLDGQWDVEDSTGANAVSYTHLGMPSRRSPAARESGLQNKARLAGS